MCMNLISSCLFNWLHNVFVFFTLQELELRILLSSNNTHGTGLCFNYSDSDLQKYLLIFFLSIISASQMGWLVLYCCVILGLPHDRGQLLPICFYFFSFLLTLYSMLFRFLCVFLLSLSPLFTILLNWISYKLHNLKILIFPTCF